MGASKKLIEYIEENFRILDKVTIELMNIIVDSVCEFYGIEPEDLNEKSKKREVVKIRQQCQFLAVKYTRATYRLIGSHIGLKDHSTVMHSKRTVINDCESRIYQEQFMG